MRVGRLASAVGKGLVAGLAGTAAMTASSAIESKVRGRKPSDAPARAAEKVLGVHPVGEEEKRRFSNLVHWGYGAAWGVPRAVLGGLGMPGPVATATHFATVWGWALTMLPVLKVAPPPTEWGAEEVAIDAMHHGVYAIACGAAYWLLQRTD
jgi:hypothetical protein